MACFTHPLFDAPLGGWGDPLEFLDETSPQQMVLPYGEHFIILTPTVLTDPAVWRTDGRTNGRAKYTVWVMKNPPLRGHDIFHFFHKRFRIFNGLFPYLLYVPIYARLQIFIQLSPILTQLCHIKRDYPVQIICSICLPSAETRAFRRLRKSLIALLIVVCGK